MSWRIRGSYFESCNCEAICPCRKIDGVPGGRSTYGECLGVLSWVIDDGHADDVPLSGLKVALATRYHDDEPGSPWRFVMYVDRRADAAQREALRGHLQRGGSAATRSNTSPGRGRNPNCVAVRPVEIDVSHEPRRQWLRIRDHVTVQNQRRMGRPGDGDMRHPRPRGERRRARRRRVARRRRPPPLRVPTATAATHRGSTTQADSTHPFSTEEAESQPVATHGNEFGDRCRASDDFLPPRRSQ